MKNISFVFSISFLFLLALQFTLCENLQANAALPNSAKNSTNKVSYLKAPLSFEINKGQSTAKYNFISHGLNFNLLLAKDEVTLLPNTNIKQSIRMKLLNQNPNPVLSGIDELSGKTNYFIGKDKKNWLTNIPLYKKVKYENVYPGIDLVYYGNQEKLEYDLVVAPGANPKDITLKIEGAKKINLDKNGDLVLHIDKELFVQKKPFVYQEISGIKKEIKGKYILKANNEISFKVDNYDAKRPLIIDPVLIYSTYLGSALPDEGNSIAVDVDGNAYVVGTTVSTNFPATGGFPASLPGSANPSNNRYVFITKFSPLGTIVYSTLLGGMKPATDYGYPHSYGYGIAVDTDGNAYITGHTGSTDFPTTRKGIFIVLNKGDTFVTKLNPSGSELVYSFRIESAYGGSSKAITVDASGNAYITGGTKLHNASPFDSLKLGSTLLIRRSTILNAFVTKLNTAGAIVYTTTFGGVPPGPSLLTNTIGHAISVDAAGSAYVIGTTFSTLFPVTSGVFQNSLKGASDAFITKLAPDGKSLIYSTFLGGTGRETDIDEIDRIDEFSGIGVSFKYDVFVDSAGNAYVTGITDSTDFPVTPGVVQSTKKDKYDIFVSKLNPTASSLIFSTYLGGTLDDAPGGLDLDSKGNVYLLGNTRSADFPTTPGALQTSLGNNPSYPVDVNITVLNPTATTLLYSTYFGGSANEGGGGIAIDTSNNIYIAGTTISMDLTTKDPSQSYLSSEPDAFVAKISAVSPNPKADMKKALAVLKTASGQFSRASRQARFISKKILPFIQEVQRLISMGGTDCEENVDVAVNDLVLILEDVLDDISGRICEFSGRSSNPNTKYRTPTKSCINQQIADDFSEVVDTSTDTALDVAEIDEDKDSVPDVCQE